MIASIGELYDALIDRGAIGEIAREWKGNGDSLNQGLRQSIGGLWDEYSKENGYVSYDDLDILRKKLINSMDNIKSNYPEYIESLDSKIDQGDSDEVKWEKLKSSGNIGFSMNEGISKNKVLSEAMAGMTKKEIQTIVRDEIGKAVKKETKDYLTKQEVKEMIRKTIVKQYKYLWEKSAFFINNI